MNSENTPLYKWYPKTRAADDFWGQVKRTVNGRPVSEEQITMIIDAIRHGLRLSSSDTLLDLCCGNGALSDRLFSLCQGGLGIDYSEYLIEVAHENFQKLPERKYILEDVEVYTRTTRSTEPFTKALCYGSFAYLPVDTAYGMLKNLRDRFSGIELLYVGNLPDKSQMDDFFHQDKYTHGVENDPNSLIGIWRTKVEFSEFAKDAGWNADVFHMPSKFYASRYRYDAILTPLS